MTLANGKVQGVFAPTGNLPTFFDEFASKGFPVGRDIFTTGAVPLDKDGEPDLKVVAALQKGAAARPEAPHAPLPPHAPAAPTV